MTVKKALKNLFKPLRKYFEKIPKPPVETSLIVLILSFNFIIALAIRLMPLKYGIFLNEFDPWFQYYQTNWIVERGWYGFIEWFSQSKDYSMWYPSGRNIPATAYPGVPFLGALIYLILQLIGLNLPLMYVVGLIPSFSAAITSVILYFIGKEIYNKLTGLLASFFFAISAATITRTSYGFYDDDGISQIYIALFILSYIKSINGKTKIWPFVNGISLALLVMTWGAYIYLLNLLALTTITLILIRRSNLNILKTYLISMTIALIMVGLIPRATPTLVSVSMILPYAGYIFTFSELYLFKYIKNINTARLPLYFAGALGIILAGIFVLVRFGYLASLPGKLSIVINPFGKSNNPWFESVGEHFAATWAQYFLNLNLMIILLPLGAYLLVKRASNTDIFMSLAVLTSLHATSSVNRLFMLSAQPIILVGCFALASLITTYANTFRTKKEYLERRRVKLFKGIPTSYSAIFLLILVLLTLFTATSAQTNPIRVGSLPQSILSTETGSLTYDWIATFEWIKNNLPEDAVIASWWDYGYWITVNTGRPSVADNANFNYTQINLIAKALVSDENTSLQIFKKLGASYLLVYEQMLDVGGTLLPVGGDLEKSYWMIRIAFNYTDEEVRKYYLNQTTLNIGLQTISLTLPIGEKAKDALIYKLLFFNMKGVREINPNIMNKIQIGMPLYFTLVYQSPNKSVLIWKIGIEERR